MCGLLFAYSIKTRKSEALSNFIDIFKQSQLPACVIDINGKVIWYNQELRDHFPKHSKVGSNFSSIFNPRKILGHIEISSVGKSWVLNHVKINKNFGIIFIPEKPLDAHWWQDIPFPIGILTKTGEIEKANTALIALIGKDYSGKDFKNWAPKFDFSEASLNKGQEILWHSDIGASAMLAWVKEYGNKRLVLLENRSEFIKLRNQAQEAQHLQILGQLSGSIVHDFNNLLTAIGGFADLLDTAVPNNEMIMEIKRNTQQASNLAQELLHFVKIKPREKGSVQISNFIKKMQLMLTKLLGENIKISINANEEGFAALSETQLEQIILNMTINSKDAMPEGGLFKIDLKKESIEKKRVAKTFILEPGKYFVLRISDTGEGISKQNISKIFSPFFSTKIKGTGLGLASCMRIIQHIGGAIDVKSSAGVTFYIYIPEINNVSIRKNEEEKAFQGPIVLKKLILVEDEATIRNLAEKSLTQEGYQIHAFGDGKEAMEALKKNSYDGLVTDAVLPSIDGIKLAHKAKKLYPKMPILMVSGYSMDDLAAKMPTGVEFLPKPFTLKNLKDKVNKVFQ